MSDNPFNSQGNDERHNGDVENSPNDTNKRTSCPEPPPGLGSAPQLPANMSQTPQPQSQIPDVLEFQSARRMVSAAQIMALVSLVIGGVVLSTAALVVAIMAYRKTLTNMRTSRSETAQTWRYLKRSCIVALVMAAIALVANAVTLALVYPTVMQMIQSGDMSAYFGTGASPQVGGGSASSFWG